ncbi:MAG TPA: hypothetical protein VHD63_13530, partial [Ktedonobacteraceae bacterium]|nr:hypothetical protein [Ktedonobacteraceae bacterium]
TPQENRALTNGSSLFFVPSYHIQPVPASAIVLTRVSPHEKTGEESQAARFPHPFMRETSRLRSPGDQAASRLHS